MKKLFIILVVACQFGLSSAVYDCFTFLNELELLHIRFDELYDVVDHFVIVEGKKSFTGKEKPLYFLENAEQYEKYKDKIIHLVIEDFPGLTAEDALEDHWKREAYSRDYLLEGLKNCNDDDIIFISDLDEIPSADAVQRVKAYFASKNATFKKNRTRRFKAQNENKLICNLEMRLLMYQLNRENAAGWCNGCKAAPYWLVKKHTPWGIKILHGKDPNLPRIPNGGWHFNTMGGQDRALYKWLQTGPLFNHEKHLLEMEKNEDLLNESYSNQVNSNSFIVPLDSTFPKYLLENQDYFKSIGWIAEE